MALEKNSRKSHLFTSKLCNTLIELEENPYPRIPNPKGCVKRASVACIIRIRPTKSNKLSKFSPRNFSASISDQLRSHFNRDWVLEGEPEILFIRRAAREGDRWTSQVALPGGKRDPGDVDDQATSIRETLEEVGIDLSSSSVLPVGKLPERIVTTEWGTVPLMVLCPFIYLVLKPEMPSSKLQPEEIASTHWVPIRALLDPILWTYEGADASDRFAKRGGVFLKYAFRMMVGRMLFGAIKLQPSESVYSDTASTPPSQDSHSLFRQMNVNLPITLRGMKLVPCRPEKPLILWGLTHGIIIDLLRLIPESKVLSSWKWPTFSAPDARFLVWLISLRFRRMKMNEMENPPKGPFMVIEEGFASHDEPGEAADSVHSNDNRDTEISNRQKHPPKVGQYSAVHYMLHGYFDLIQRGLFFSLALRVGIGIAVFSHAFSSARFRR